MTAPNLLTLLRIALIPLIIALLYANQFFLSAAVFLFAGALDAADGYLARRLNMTSNFGKLMDPMADKLLVISVLVTLVEKGLAASFPVILITAREIVVSSMRGEGKILEAKIFGKIKTVIQIAAVLMLILNMPYAVLVLWAAVFASIYSGVLYCAGRS